MWRNTKLFTLVRLITLHVTVATSYLQSTTIANVTVIDVVRGEVNSDMTIVVTGNRISQLGSSNTAVITDGTRIVDGRGKFIIPGLWDMHVHLGYATEASIPVMIASGITGVRDMGSPSFETLRRWRVEALSGARIGRPALSHLDKFCNATRQTRSIFLYATGMRPAVQQISSRRQASTSSRSTNYSIGTPTSQSPMKPARSACPLRATFRLG
jgi:hypothetical protein